MHTRLFRLPCFNNDSFWHEFQSGGHALRVTTTKADTSEKPKRLSKLSKLSELFRAIWKKKTITLASVRFSFVPRVVLECRHVSTTPCAEIMEKLTDRGIWKKIYIRTSVRSKNSLRSSFSSFSLNVDTFLQHLTRKSSTKLFVRKILLFESLSLVIRQVRSHFIPSV